MSRDGMAIQTLVTHPRRVRSYAPCYHINGQSSPPPDAPRASDNATVRCMTFFLS